MPPKRLAHAQSLRDAFTEAHSCAVVEQWATETISHAEKLSQEVSSQFDTVQQSKYTPANAEKTPEQIVSVLLKYQALCRKVFSDAEAIRTVILVRIPERKEEDNLGVAVQYAVLKMLDDVQSKALGGGGGGGEKGDAGSTVRTPCGVFSLHAYLEARSGVEEKLLGKADEKKDNNNNNNNNSKGSNSPSLVLDLRQVDADILLKVELSALQLVSALRAFVNAYALNWKKLIEPRTGGDRMVS